MVTLRTHGDLITCGEEARKEGRDVERGRSGWVVDSCGGGFEGREGRKGRDVKKGRKEVGGCEGEEGGEGGMWRKEGVSGGQLLGV